MNKPNSERYCNYLSTGFFLINYHLSEEFKNLWIMLQHISKFHYIIYFQKADEIRSFSSSPFLIRELLWQIKSMYHPIILYKNALLFFYFNFFPQCRVHLFCFLFLLSVKRGSHNFHITVALDFLFYQLNRCIGDACVCLNKNVISTWKTKIA